MNIAEYYTEIEKIVNKDCNRIMNEILDLYYKKVEVNKSFTTIVKERINPKYLYLLETYYNKIIKLIPENLYICPTGQWALVTEKEFNEIIFTNRYISNIKEKEISIVVDNIVNDLINNNSIDFFDTINKYIEPLTEKDSFLKNSKYFMEQIYYSLEKKGYTIISINPLKIKAK